MNIIEYYSCSISKSYHSYILTCVVVYPQQGAHCHIVTTSTQWGGEGKSEGKTTHGVSKKLFNR